VTSLLLLLLLLLLLMRMMSNAFTLTYSTCLAARAELIHPALARHT
jgi:hypothetical protein